MESTAISGKNNWHGSFLLELSLNLDHTDRSWNEDHSSINWTDNNNHHQFFFDYIDNEEEISNWLKNSTIAGSKYLYTWLDYHDPIIKIRTDEFIQYWNEFYIASVEGAIFVTTDGKYYMEFTDDYKYHLNSNFEIKPGSKVIT